MFIMMDNSDADADNYIYCDECEEEYVEECPKHGPLHHIPDSLANEEEVVNQEYAKSTVPECLRVAPSAIKNVGLGVWTTRTIPTRSYFGPYKGIVRSQSNTDSYGWQVQMAANGVETMYIDASDPSKSNWMRYVRCARNFHEQNVVAYQFKGSVYYAVLREIPAYTELYVYFDDDYARDFGIDPSRYFDKVKEPLPVETFACEICCKKFSSPIERDEHAPTCRRASDSPNEADDCDPCQVCLMKHRKRSMHVPTKNDNLTLHICNVKIDKTGEQRYRMISYRARDRRTSFASERPS